MNQNELVAVVGASANPERFSFKAVKMLRDYGYQAVPVHPSGKPVCGSDTKRSLSEIKKPIDTISLYLGAKNSAPITSQIIAAKPRRLILNPGAESTELRTAAEKAGIEVVEDCTLVLLQSGRF